MHRARPARSGHTTTRMGDSYDEVVWKTISATAASGSVKDLWKAADDLILASGTHHVYIEDFDVQKDGTLSVPDCSDLGW